MDIAHIAASDEGKALVARATTGPYGANEAKILNASHVVVFCARDGWSDEHMQEVVEIDLHKNLGDTQHWMEKQVYIALGTLLFGAAALGIDATPIEGFDRATLDTELSLKERGLTSVVIAALGYRSDDDFNAGLPKSRLPADELFTLL